MGVLEYKLEVITRKYIYIKHLRPRVLRPLISTSELSTDIVLVYTILFCLLCALESKGVMVYKHENEFH